MTPRRLAESQWDFNSDTWPDSDLIAIGADLEPATLLAAYVSGAFPMHIQGRLGWWSPMIRGILRPGDLHISRSLRKSAKRFHMTVDTAFDDVVSACADPARPHAWITEEFRDAYYRLYELSWAHSIEVRDSNGDLAGGLYGVAIGGLFAGESMFHRQRDASKVALMFLVDIMGPTRLIDVQWSTSHLASLGVTTCSRAHYLDLLPGLCAQELPPRWR